MKQSGFTLIELVIVIVVLGILAAVAIPQYIDMAPQAADATAKGVATAVTSGGTLNMSTRAASYGASGTPVTSATTCAGLTALLNDGVLPPDVVFVSPTSTLSCAGVGTSDATTCRLAHNKGTPAGFPVIASCTG